MEKYAISKDGDEKGRRSDSVYARAALATIVAMLVLSVCLPLVACASAVGISFSVDAITINVGETRDLFPYIKFDPSTADDKTVTLVADGDCIEIVGTSVRAVSAGAATVTATADGGKSARMAITVEYRTALDLSMEHTGNTVQTAENGDMPDSVSFSVVTDVHIDPSAECEWSVNGKTQSARGREFEFSPKGYGIFDVTAKLGGLSATERVTVYRPTTVVAESEGVVDQGGDYSIVKFTAKESIDTRNPRSVVEWRVNGETKSQGLVFEFIPQTRGEYEVELFVNGMRRAFADGDTVTVRAGARAPTGEVVFDDCGGVRVVWRDGRPLRSISVTSPDGVRTVYSPSDLSHAYLFGDGYFDATGIIDVCSSEPAEYNLRLNADAAGERFVFMQYGGEVEYYIENNVLLRNRFLSGADDAAMYVEELYACSFDTDSAYLARGVDYAAVCAAMEKTAARLNANIETERSGNVVTVRLSEYVNAPDPSDAVRRDQSFTRLHTDLPHIEYDPSARRPSSYKFAIDRAKRSVSVSNSEQLRIAVCGGVAPEPDNGALVNTYRRARAVLIGIIGADYTDVQKVHSVYDWLQWYTHKIVNSVDTYGKFAESVFGGSVTPFGEVTDEGAAKCFALLCGIEGIECEIAVCDVNGATRYYNRVSLDGVRYNIDVFGGEIERNGRGEISSHSGLLFGDVTAAARGYASDVTDAFDEGRATYLDKLLYSDGIFDYYIDSAEKTDYDSVRAAVFASFETKSRTDVTIAGVDSTLTVMNTTFGAEFIFDPRLTDGERALLVGYISRAANEFAEERLGKAFAANTVNVYLSEYGAHIIALIP